MKKLLFATLIFFGISATASPQSGNPFILFLVGTGSTGGGASGGIDTLFHQSFSNAANITINLANDTDYAFIVVVMQKIIPASSGVSLAATTSSDGSTFHTGATDYSWFWGNNAGFNPSSSGDASATVIGGGGLPNGTGQCTDSWFVIFHPGDASVQPSIRGDMVIPGAPVGDIDFAVKRLNAEKTKEIRFTPSSGNVSADVYVVGYFHK